MSRRSADKLLIGAHTSAAGGVYNALLEGVEIGATTIQLFTANQKQWKGKPISAKDGDLFRQSLKETGLQKIMSHASYLINLASAKPENRDKSQIALKEEVERCLDLGISFLNFHPGAHLTNSLEQGIEYIIEGILKMEAMLEGGKTRLLLETTAGQGTSIGWRFEEIGAIIDGVKGKVPIGVCIDTCHIFAAGYDIRTPASWEKTLTAFDKAIGRHHLYAFHLNDSMKALGSRRDRHAALGEGEIGMGCFKFLMHDPQLREIPKYLETPGGDPLWTKEIATLRRFAK